MIPTISRSVRYAVVPSASAETSGVLAGRLLDAAVPEQQRTNWCWLAVGVGVAEAYGTAARTQCELATRLLGRGCCPDGTGCNVPGRLPAALGAHHASSFTAPGHQTFEFVKEQIDGGHPIGVAVARRHGGAGHAVLITGYVESETDKLLWICDPWYGRREACLFNEFLSNYEQDGTWSASYTTGGGTVPEATRS